MQLLDDESRCLSDEVGISRYDLVEHVLNLVIEFEVVEDYMI